MNTTVNPGAEADRKNALVQTVAARVYLIAIGLGLIALLMTARIIQPAPEGYGTHQQLGLPPCGFQLMFGRPCPSCGMTTSWAWLMRGKLVASANANPGGMLLGIGSLIAAPWLIVSGIRGKWVWGLPGMFPMAIVAAAVALTTMVTWVYRLFG